MKKFLCIMVLALSTTSVFAQLYLRGNIGYNLPANGQDLGGNTREVYNNQTGEYSGYSEVVHGSYGSGLSFQLGIGGSLNGSLGYDVEVGYLIGKKYSTGYIYSDGFYEEREESEFSSRSFQFAPSLTFTAGTGNIQPYTRIGPVLALTKLKYKDLSYDTYIESKEIMEYEYTGGISLGFKGVLGVTFNADKKLQFFAEANFVSLSYSPKEGELTGYTIDGENVLNSIPKEDRKIEFKDKINFDDDDGNYELRSKYSMGSIGIQVGIKFVLK